MRRLLLLAILALLSAASISQAADIGIFHDPAFPSIGAPASMQRLEKLLSDAGYTIKSLSAADLMNEQVLDISNFGLLLLPQAESYPAKGREILFRYLAQGGDFISVGGYAFDRLFYQDTSGKWVAREEMFGKMVLDPEVKPMTLFDFEQSLDTWRPGGGTAEMPSVKFAQDDTGGKAMEVLIPNYQNYHGVTSEIDREIPKGSNFIFFRARGDAVTPEITVECDEKDGSRWIAVVQITPEWKDYYLPAKDFEHWYDGTNRRDELHIDNAKTLAFGAAFTHTKRLMEGPHTFRIDNVEAVKGTISDPGDDRINSRFSGKDTAGLVGVFDASCPLKWVTQVTCDPGQVFLTARIELQGNFEGYSAIGMFPEESTRWVPLLQGFDKYERPRGSVGSLVINYSGDRKGSAWAFFGVNNSDLLGNAEMGKAFVQLVNAMTRGLYLHGTGTDLACYRPGEQAKVSTSVSNFGATEQKVTLWLQVLDGDGDVIGGDGWDFSLAAGESRDFSTEWKVTESAPDFCRVAAILLVNGRPVDTEEAAFTVWNETVLRSGPKLAFDGTRFMLDGAPRFLFGSNETATFWSGLAKNNPLGWDKEIRTMVNDGLRVIRVHTAPQFFWPEESNPNEAQFRKLDAWVLLCRKHGITPYIDVMDWAEGLKDPWLHGQNYMMDPLAQAGQRKYVTAFASRYKDAAGMMWDADNEVVDDTRPDPIHNKLWNEWLKEKYGSQEGLEKAWGKYLRGEKLGEVAYDPGDDAWDSRRSFDWRYFHRTNVRDRFVRNFADAVRAADPDAIASISGLNIGGMDPLTITEPLDLGDNHFYHSLHLLPDVIKGSDLRSLGISSAIGEYGCSTHPTGGDVSYYFPPDEQATRFLWIGHYLLGCGGSMALTWDFRDPLSGSFPWGVHYAGDLIEKDVLHAQTQMVRLFNRLPVDGTVPQVLVCVPDNNRLGGRGGDALGAAHRCMKVLVDNGVDFALITEWTLDRIPAGTKAIFFPTPYCIGDETFARLKAFVEAGGSLYFSGDISYSPDREYLGDARLRELTGLSGHEPKLQDGQAPWEVISAEPNAVTTKRLGKGIVCYSPEPIEMGQYSRDAMAKVWDVYREFLNTAGIEPNRVVPAGLPVHCFRQPLDGGGSVYVLINRDAVKAHRVGLDLPIGRLEMQLGALKPGLVAVDAKGNILALEAQGLVSLGGAPVVDAKGHFMLKTLDGLDVRKSREIMVLPVGAGELTVHSSAAWRSPVAKLGQEEAGTWRSLADLKPIVKVGGLQVKWDEVQATGMLLLTERAQADQAVKAAVNPLSVK